MPGGEAVYRFTHKAKEQLKWNLLRKSMFEYMGFEYIGPIDGHDLKHLIRVINRAKNAEGPVLIHVVTQKGKGYQPAGADGCAAG